MAKRGRKPIVTKHNARHNWCAWLDAAGMKVRDIAKETGMSPENIYRLRGTKMYLAVRHGYAEEIIEKGVSESMAHIVADAPKNVEFLKDLRDGEFDSDDLDRMKMRFEASKELLSHQHPKQTKQTTDSTHRFVIEDSRRLQMMRDCEEAELPIIPLRKAIVDARATYEPE